jgi:predicted dehydrogenase
MLTAIIGGGWPGVAHSKGYLTAGGCRVVAVADPIPERQAQLAESWPNAKKYTDAREAVLDPTVEAISICLPTHVRPAVVTAALKAGKHVIVETPPGATMRDARAAVTAAAKFGKVLAYAFQRRFGSAEMAAKAAIEKGLIGDANHVRATWMRTRGVPVGTGWYTDKSKSGGGALIDLGCPMLDLGWHLLGRPAPVSVYAITRRQFDLPPPGDVEDSVIAVVRFEGDKTLELTASWAINQPPGHVGTTCRVHGSDGAIDVHTRQGPLLFRGFNAKGECKSVPLKQPKVSGHPAMLRQFREAVLGKAVPAVDGHQGILLMQMIEGLYKSAETGRSVEVRTRPATPSFDADAVAVVEPV